MSESLHENLLIDLALQGMREGDGPGDAYVLESDTVEAMNSALDDLLHSEALEAVLGEFVVFACWLGESQRSPETCEQLLKVADRAIPALEQRGFQAQHLADALGAKERDFSKITGLTDGSDFSAVEVDAKNVTQGGRFGSAHFGPTAAQGKIVLLSWVPS